jgi:MSHA biogenesis protein MshQ
MIRLLKLPALGLLLALCALPAQAVNYVFPGTLPAGCSGSAGTYTCGSVTLGNNDTFTLGAPLPATINVNGNFNTGNRPFINSAGAASNLAIHVTGSVNIGNQGQINGSLTAAGPLNLGNSTSVASCVRSSTSSTINLSNNVTVGGVCCGALGSCTSSCVVNNSGSPMPALCAAPPSPSMPSRFNAFETTSAAGSITGVITTKRAGVTHSVAIVAINTAGTGVATTFTGNVRVEVLDASNNTGGLDSSTNCRSSWSVATGTTATTLNFAASDQGRKNVSLTVAEAFPNARIRVSHPDTGTATVVGCSTDNFAIRPDRFDTLAASDSNASTSGYTPGRTLHNGGNAGGVVHKAGQPFTVSTRALNGANVVTQRYTALPTVSVTACSNLGASTNACGGTLGTWSLPLVNTNGSIATSTARYDEAGAFRLELSDTTFADVDALDSTLAERTIASTAVIVGRFIPNHFTVVTALPTPLVPQLRTFNSSTCTNRSFTYLGQPFGYARLPEATVQAVNAQGVATTNYPAAKYNPLLVPPAVVVAQSYAVGASAPGLSTTGTSAPTITAGASGAATLRTQVSDTLTMVRPAAAPVTPFNADTASTGISLTWSVSDSSEIATGSPAGNEAIGTPAPLVYSTIAFDAGSEFRYGQLRLGSAYGSELLALPVMLETQHWNGTNFITNTADQCSTLPTGSVALGNFRSGLAACETATATASISFANGRSLLRMVAPGNGNAGSVDATLQLGNTLTPGAQRCSAVGPTATAAVPAGMPWLQSRLPGGTTYDQNPSARFSFGQFRSPLIHQREVY